jgi:hypothetical protein
MKRELTADEITTLNQSLAVLGFDAMKESLELVRLGIPNHIIVKRILQQWSAACTPSKSRKRQQAKVIDFYSRQVRQ